MRAWLALLLATLLLPAWAQNLPPPQKRDAKEDARPKPVKSQKARAAQKAHARATPEQIRKFNQLQQKSDRR